MDQIAEGWRQVEAGVSLVHSSGLARWEAQNLSFSAIQENEFESPTGHRRLHQKYGRLISWLTFAVGVEYVCKGILLLKGVNVLTHAKVIRPPDVDEDIGDWVCLVNGKAPSVHREEIKSQTLGKLDFANILTKGSDRELVSASIKFLASTIRNRDAHRYAENVRATHFSSVRLLFVPTLNILLAQLEEEESRKRLATVSA